jgi:hypothetical protein
VLFFRQLNRGGKFFWVEELMGMTDKKRF